MCKQFKLQALLLIALVSIQIADRIRYRSHAYSILGVTAEVAGSMVISVIDSKQQLIPCVTISIDAALTVNVKLNSTSLIPSLLYDYSSITLKVCNGLIALQLFWLLI